ncbi:MULTISPECIES: hypothetical protein [unclassified Modestobacter]
MDVRGVDPRDVSWEVDAPRYRVYLWSAGPGAWSDEYELSGAGVDAAAVLAWATGRVAEPGMDRFEAFVVVDGVREGRGLVRLTTSP